MRRLVLAVFVLCAIFAQAQQPTCSCGSNPPGPPKTRTMPVYAGAPEDLVKTGIL